MSLNGMLRSLSPPLCGTCGSVVEPNGKIVLECGHGLCARCVRDPCPECTEDKEVQELEALLQEEKARLIALIRASTKVRDEFLGALNHLPHNLVSEWQQDQKRKKEATRAGRDMGIDDAKKKHLKEIKQILKKFYREHSERSQYLSSLSTSASAHISLQCDRGADRDLLLDHGAKYTFEFKNESAFDPGLQIMSHVLKSMFFMGTKEERDAEKKRDSSVTPKRKISANAAPFIPGNASTPSPPPPSSTANVNSSSVMFTNSARNTPALGATPAAPAVPPPLSNNNPFRPRAGVMLVPPPYTPQVGATPYSVMADQRLAAMAAAGYPTPMFNNSGMYRTYMSGLPPPTNRTVMKGGVGANANNLETRVFNPHAVAAAHSSAQYGASSSSSNTQNKLPSQMSVPPPAVPSKAAEKSKKVIKVTKSNLVMSSAPSPITTSVALNAMSGDALFATEVTQSFPEMSLAFLNDPSSSSGSSELQARLRNAKIWDSASVSPPSSAPGSSSFLSGNTLTPSFPSNGISFQDGLSNLNLTAKEIFNSTDSNLENKVENTKDQNLDSDGISSNSNNGARSLTDQDHGGFKPMTDHPVIDQLQEQIKQLRMGSDSNENVSDSGGSLMAATSTYSTWPDPETRNNNDPRTRLFGNLWADNNDHHQLSKDISKSSGVFSSSSPRDDEVDALEVLLKSREKKEAEEQNRQKEMFQQQLQHQQHKQQKQVALKNPSSTWPDRDPQPAATASVIQEPAANATTPKPAMSWSKMASMKLPPPEKIRAVNLRPTCFLDIAFRGDVFRVLIRVRPDKAKKMSENFIRLCTGRGGRSYKGCRFFICKPDDHIVTGDMDNQDGSGGHSSYPDKRTILSDLSSLADQVGAVRMKCLDDEKIEDNRCHISSLFLVWVGEIDFNTYKYTLVFGEVIEGLKHLVAASRVGMRSNKLGQYEVKEIIEIVDSGTV